MAPRMDRIFKPPFSMTGAISQDRQSCQFLFLLDKNPTVVPVGSAGERLGGARKVVYGAARSNSERAAPSACVGKRYSAPQIVWNKSTRRAGELAAGRGMVGPVAEDLVDHRRIFDACPERVEGAAIIFKAPPKLGQCSRSILKTRLSSQAQLMRGVSPCA